MKRGTGRASAARGSTGRALRLRLGPVTLLGDLYAFFQEHRRCGDLDTAIEGVIDARRWTRHEDVI